ncbi:MAG: uroporphyrinogen-III C-methyltransferase, partial [Acidobacteriota bacterium]|nr:uroporphyrinogen-III C-methyltransferase [Acidobacteriota bacterium]
EHGGSPPLSVVCTGEVAIVGAGPGDPELLTLRAVRLIAAADDLVVDALVPPEVYASSPASVVYVGKRAGRPRPSQRRIGGILVSLARRGRRVVRLKGGDPSVFGRLGEEVADLEAAGIRYEVVPGVSSIQAAAVAAGVPLTDRDLADRFIVLTGHRRSGHAPVRELPAYDPEVTLVWLMPLKTLPELVDAALEAGYPGALPAVVVSRASTRHQAVVGATLEELLTAVEASGLETPATVLVGRVAHRALSAARAPAIRSLASRA